MELKMNALEVKECLINAGVDHLYHANTVATAISFINNGGLISRETMESMNLPQTQQQSDVLDKALGIYNDIFFDSVDIHKQLSDVNNYGPIVFVYSIEVLNEVFEYDIGITYDNPIRWTVDMPCAKRYLQSKEDFFFYQKGNFAQHITVRNISVPLSFKHIEKIIIDYPGKEREKYYNDAISEISSAIYKNNLNIPIQKRECPEFCKCKDKYRLFKEGYTFHRFKLSI